VSNKSKIEWTDRVWNPVTGCTKISTGCENCYAERMAKRMHAMGQPNYKKGFEVTEHPHMLERPFRLRNPYKIFVCSMGDLFHGKVSFEYIAAVFGVMAANPQHQFQVLTKRPGTMKLWFEWISHFKDGESLNCAYQLLYHERAYHPKEDGGPIHCKWGPDPDAAWPLPNVWLGVTAENQKTADERIPLLLQCPAAVRFVSCEPLLGSIDLTELTLVQPDQKWGVGVHLDALSGHVKGPDEMINKLDWVIAGCESGPRRRETKKEWVNDLQQQCGEAGVPFFLKQMEVDGVLEKMPKLNGQVWNQFPEVSG